MGIYLVTGGCGFIGSHLSEALTRKGHIVRILDDLSTGKSSHVPHGAELTVGDVADEAITRKVMSGVDGCFHLAAIASVERSTVDWVGTHRINQTGSISIFQAARLARRGDRIPVVYASSAAVYGNLSHALHETAQVRPTSGYGADKLGSEHHAVVAGAVHEVPTCGLRFFNVFGPRQDPSSPYSGVISIFANRLASGRPITIFGDGTQTRDFIFVHDVVRALEAALLHASVDAPVYNVCTGRSTSIRSLADTLSGILGVTAEIEFDEARSGEVQHSRGDPSRARDELGFEARFTVTEGLTATLAAL